MDSFVNFTLQFLEYIVIGSLFMASLIYALNTKTDWIIGIRKYLDEALLENISPSKKQKEELRKNDKTPQQYIEELQKNEESPKEWRVLKYILIFVLVYFNGVLMNALFFSIDDSECLDTHFHRYFISQASKELKLTEYPMDSIQFGSYVPRLLAKYKTDTFSNYEPYISSLIYQSHWRSKDSKSYESTLGGSHKQIRVIRGAFIPFFIVLVVSAIKVFIFLHFQYLLRKAERESKGADEDRSNQIFDKFKQRIESFHQPFEKLLYDHKNHLEKRWEKYGKNSSNWRIRTYLFSCLAYLFSFLFGHPISHPKLNSTNQSLFMVLLSPKNKTRTTVHQKLIIKIAITKTTHLS